VNNRQDARAIEQSTPEDRHRPGARQITTKAESRSDSKKHRALDEGQLTNQRTNN